MAKNPLLEAVWLCSESCSTFGLDTDWKAWVLLNRVLNEDVGGGDDVGSQAIDVRLLIHAAY
jgi:hypothetical protein